MKQFIILLLSLCLFFIDSSKLTADETSLQNIPQADTEGIVLSSKVLSLQGVVCPFNGSLVKNRNGDGYLLFFREELMGLSEESPGGARLGVAFLNKQFEQTKEVFFPPYPIFGKSVEDPRAFWIQDSLYILYCIYPRPAPSTLCLVKVHPETLLPLSIQKLSHDKYPEKNWFPLLSKNTTTPIPFVRNIFPIDIVQINPSAKTHSFSNQCLTVPRLNPPTWKWGPLSGGTQGVLMDNRFLSFFHSWFLEPNGKRTYVFGACTFETTPPFQMKEISPYPLLFKDLYTSKPFNLMGNPYTRRWAQVLEKVIFPSGFVEETLPSGQEILHLSCGENDNSIRIITIDKKALLKSLIPVSETKQKTISNE